VELEEKSGNEENAEENTTYDPQKDQDLFGSVFGDQGATSGGQTGGAPPTPEQEAAATTDLEAAKSEVAAPDGAIPEESDSGMIQSASPEDELASAIDELPEATPEEEESTMSLEELLGEDEEEGGEEKPFGDGEITEDEAVNMDRK
jgi:hypothetical protein